MIQYILQPNLRSEMDARKIYISKVFHCSFVQRLSSPRFIELVSYFPTTELYLFITGHNYWVAKFLESAHSDVSSTVIINSCTPRRVLPHSSLIKNIYFCKTNSRGVAHRRDGSAFGLGFDVTDSELDLLNAAGSDLVSKLQIAYQKVA